MTSSMMVKKPAGFVLARHCRLTDPALRTRHWALTISHPPANPARRGRAGETDGHFDYPAGLSMSFRLFIRDVPESS